MTYVTFPSGTNIHVENESLLHAATCKSVNTICVSLIPFRIHRLTQRTLQLPLFVKINFKKDTKKQKTRKT